MEEISGNIHMSANVEWVKLFADFAGAMSSVRAPGTEVVGQPASGSTNKESRRSEEASGGTTVTTAKNAQ